MGDSLENKPICRVCLKVIDPNTQGFGYIEDETGTLKEMLFCCVPELDIYVSTDPVVCLPCIQTLVVVYNFKTKCINTETVVRSYMQKNNLVEYSHVNLNCVVQDLLETNKQKKVAQGNQSEVKLKIIKDVDNQESEKLNDKLCPPRKEISNENVTNFHFLPSITERLTETNENDFKSDSTSNASTSSEEFSTSLQNGAPTSQINHDKNLLHFALTNSEVESSSNTQSSRESLHSPHYDRMPPLMSPPPQSKEVVGSMDSFPPNMLPRPPHLFYFRPPFRLCRSPMPNNMGSPRYMEMRNNCFELNRYPMNADHFDRRSPTYSNRFHLDSFHPYGPRMPHTFSKPPPQVMLSQMGHPPMGLPQMPLSQTSHLQMGSSPQVPPPLRCFTRNPTPYPMAFRPPPLAAANVFFRPYVPSNIPPHLNSVLQDNCRNTPQPSSPFLSSLPAIESPVVPLSVDIPALRASDSLSESQNDVNALHQVYNRGDNDSDEKLVENIEKQLDELIRNVQTQEGKDLEISKEPENTEEQNESCESLEVAQPLEDKNLVIKIPRDFLDFPADKTENSNDDDVDCNSDNKVLSDKENITENSTLENHDIDFEMADETTKSPKSPNDNSNSFVYECFKCPFNTPSTEAFISHRQKCKEEFKLPEKCPHCSFSTSTEAALQKHIKYEHTAAAWFYCEQCPYKSLDKDSLRSHRSEQHNKKRECEECGYTTSDKESFNKHVRNAHIMKKREFSCKFCDFKSYSEIKFDNHNKNNKHTTTSVHCEWCSYSTVDKANFRRHIFTHSPKKIDCDFCDYKNGSPYQLIKHLRKYHNGVGVEDVDLKNNVPLTEVIEDIRASIKEVMEITI